MTGKDLTQGSIPKHILTLAIPIFIGLLLTMGYGIINTIWIGNLLGKEAVGAAAISFSISFVLLGIASGSTVAVTVLISKNYGCKDYEKIKKVVGTAFSFFTLADVVLTLVAIFFKSELLRLMSTPKAIFHESSEYLTITLIGFLITFIYFVFSAIFNGLGDTKTPAMFLFISTGLNAVLDPFLIKAFGLNGAAFATLIGGICALGAATAYFKKKCTFVTINRETLKIDKPVLIEMLRIGLPSTVEQCLTPISLIILTGFINSFGTDAISAYGAANKLDYLVIMPSMAMLTAASVITGQNLGALKPERVKKVFNWGILINIILGIAVSLIVAAFPEGLLHILVRDDHVIRLGTDYLRIIGPAYCLISVTYLCNGILVGAGKTLITMTISLITLFLLRIPLVYLLSESLGLKGIWMACTVTYLLMALMAVAYYATGKWAKYTEREMMLKITVNNL